MQTLTQAELENISGAGYLYFMRPRTPTTRTPIINSERPAYDNSGCPSFVENNGYKFYLQPGGYYF